jgi:hypothetical protein
MVILFNKGREIDILAEASLNIITLTLAKIQQSSGKGGRKKIIRMLSV